MTNLYTFKQSDLDLFNSNNCVMYVNGASIEVGDVLDNTDNLELHSNVGITINSASFYAWFSGKYKKVVATISGSVASFDISSISGAATVLNWDIDVSSSVVATFEQKDLDYWALTGGVGYLDDVLVSVGDSWLKSQTLKIVSPDGWEYSSGTVGGYVDGSYKSSVGVIEPVNVVSFTSDERLVLDDWEFIATQITPNVVGANSLFKVTSENISEIMNNRLQWVTIDTEQNSSSVDFGNYILGLIQLPWGLSEEFILNDEVINLLSWNTGVVAPKLLDDSYTYDLGEIDLSDKAVTNNYTNSKIVINLPRSEPLELVPDVVLGYVLKIEYVVSLYDGTTTINIKRDNTILYSKTVDLGVGIPYGASFHTAIHSLDNSDVNLGVENGILTPFIEIYTGSDLSQLESIFSTPITATELISAQDGYFYVENVDLNFKCSSGEREEIENILMSGVFNNA